MSTIPRRDFMKLAGTLTLGFSLPGLAISRIANLSQLPLDQVGLSPYIQIAKDGIVTLICPRPDMGQGASQAMPMLIAEELEVRMEDIIVKFSDGQSQFGGQGAGGSSSVRSKYQSLRQVGATAREMLKQAAANKWNCAVADCKAENGKIINKTNDAILSYGALVDEAAKLTPPKDVKLKTPKEFKLIGKSLPRLDVPTRVNGSAVFGLDVQVPGMLYAVVQHSPMIHGKIKSIDDAAALAIPGVRKVVRTERLLPYKKLEAVAVIADNTWAAIQGRKALKVEWENGDNAKTSTTAYFQNLRELVKKDGFTMTDAKGDVESGLKTSVKTLEAVYETPFTAHAPLEPENSTAYVQGDKVEIWAPVQGPDNLISYVVQKYGYKKENVKVNTQLLGGSFGRKSYYDYALEAVDLSKQMNAPVKVTWTREDDLSQGPFRPGMLSAMRGGIDANGIVQAFEHKIVGAFLGWQIFKADPTKSTSWSEGINQEDSPYAIPNRAQKFVLAETEIPVLWWRSVYASTNLFGHECFIDELARAAKQDPMAFRLKMLAGEPRFAAVLQLLKEKSGYGQPLPAGHAMGIAMSRSFKSICAYAVTVSKRGKGVKIEKVVGVIDVGVAINPDNVKAQTEGNVVMGLSAALKNAITFEDGQSQQSNYHQFNIFRINETPKIAIHVMPSEADPGGAGEPGLPPVAPALCNAIFNLTGKRIRKLPFDLENVG